MMPVESSQVVSPASFAVAAARYADDHGLFDGVRRLLVGCSGGADSTVLLDALLALAPEAELELAVCHLNHGLRAAATADEQHVRAMAESYGLPLFVDHVDLASETGSLEAVARRARLDFFARAVEQWSADGIALGHSADDQAETVLMNLARGTGLRGLGGMRPRTAVNGMLILRPLMFARRAAIRAYARARGLTWKEDETNQDLALTRNRVRQRLLPELENLHPGAVDNLVRAAALAQDEDEWLAAEVETTYRALHREDPLPGAVALELTGFRQTALGLQRRLVRRALEQVRGHGRGISAAHVEAVLEEACGPAGGTVDLPGARVQGGDGILRLLPLEGRVLKQRSPPSQEHD
jgi:tRNA(Ile)-lysidine synthase